MTTLLEQAARVSELSMQVIARRKEEDQTAAWDAHEAAIKDLIGKLVPAVEFLRWLKGMDTDLDPKSPTGLPKAKKSVEKLLTSIIDGPDPTAAGELVRNIRNTVDTVVTNHNEIAAKAWNSYTKKDEWDNPDIYAAFRNDDQHGDNYRELVEVTTTYRSLVGRQYLDRKGYRTEFEEILQKRTRLLQALPPMDDVEIRTFLEHAATDGAALSELTDKVQTWLKENRLTAKYAVKRRGS